MAMVKSRRCRSITQARTMPAFYRLFRSTRIGCLAALLLITGATAAEDSLFGGGNRSGLVTSQGFASGDEVLLDVDVAFVPGIRRRGKLIELYWDIAPDYYLYRRQFRLLGPGGEDLTAGAQFSRGLQKDDGYFGRVEIYYHSARASIEQDDIIGTQTRDTAGKLAVSVKYQGCADAGLCYPVQTRTLSLPLED